MNLTEMMLYMERNPWAGDLLMVVVGVMIMIVVIAKGASRGNQHLR